MQACWLNLLNRLDASLCLKLYRFRNWLPKKLFIRLFLFFFFFFVHVWCWVNLGSTLSSQAPLSFIPPSPHALYTPVVDIYTIWTVALLACVYTTTTILWWLSILPIEATSRHTLCCCRGYGAHGMDLPESMWITTIVIATSVISCLLSVLPSCSWGNRDFLLIDVFLVTSPLPYLLSSTSTASHSGLWELRKYVNYSSISAVAHCARMKERKEKMKKRKCFAEEVCTKQCVRVCVQAVPTYSLPSLWFGLVGT